MNHQFCGGSKPEIDATKKLCGGGFRRPWAPLIKMDAAVKARGGKNFNSFGDGALAEGRLRAAWAAHGRLAIRQAVGVR
jgi:hypothetical protein